MLIWFKKCLPCCLKENNLTQSETSTNKIKRLVSSVSFGSFSNNKITNIICKICNKEIHHEKKSCDCLTKDELHPNSKEVEMKIREKYINDHNTIQQVIQIDKNPDKLLYLVTDIYDIVEKSTLNDDLTPKRLEKVKENLINEICVHIEDYIKNE